MTIRNKIKTYLSEPANKHTVQDIRIGLGYTMVLLENGQAGLAYTPHRDMPAGCSLFPDFMPSKNTTACALLDLITSDNPVKTAVGMATANALANGYANHFTTGDVLEKTAVNANDYVGMVGHFAPLVAPLRKMAKKLIIFEQIDQSKGALIPSSEIEKQLPECTVAVITATTLINHSFEKIIPFAENCREVILLGASTPLLPEIFLQTPVTCLSGVIVADIEETLRIVSFGGGMRLFKKCIRKVNIRLRRGLSDG